MKINQKGITLVELLAAIVIVGFLTILIWRVFFQAIDFNSYAVTEQTLQQEANIILSSLQSAHTKNEIDHIEIDSSKKTLTIVYKPATPAVPNESFSRSGINYQLYATQPSISKNVVTGSKVDSLSPQLKLDNRVDFPIHLVLSSKDSKGRPIVFLISTTLSKLTTK